MRTPTKHTARDGTVTFVVRYRVPSKVDGKRDGSTSQTFDDLADAKLFAVLLDAVGPDRALAEFTKATHDGNSPSLNSVAADHIRLLTDIEDGTRLSYARLWARTWGPLIGDLPVSLITKDRIAEATLALIKRYSAKSLKNQRGLLFAVCGRAIDEGYLTKNPTTKLKIPRSKENERVEMRLLTEDELSAILAATSDHYRPLVRFLADTGARWGEAVALEVADVALDRKPYPQVHIRQALKWSPDNARTIGPTKTEKSNRWIPLTGELRDDLARLTAGRPRDALVFTAPRGGAVQHRTFWSDIWRKALEDAKIPEPRPRLHDLRHGFASRALANGTPINVLQALMGHQHSSTTLDTYSHLMPDALSQAVQAMEAVALPSRLPQQSQLER
jgi:integrase